MSEVGDDKSTGTILTERSRVSLSIGALWSLAALVGGLVMGYSSQQATAQTAFREVLKDELQHYTTRAEIQQELRSIDQKLSDLKLLVGTGRKM